MMPIRRRFGLPATALAILVLSGSSAIAGGPHKRVVVGYVPVYPATAAAPVAGAPVAYAPVAYGTYAAAPVVGYAPAPTGTYAAAPVAGYAPAPTGTYAAAPAAGYAAAPTAGSMYLVGYYYGYQASTGGAAAAPPAQAAPPVAGAPGASGTVPQPPAGARLTDTAKRQEIVNLLAQSNTTLTNAKVSDDLRMFKLNAEATQLYAAKLGVAEDALTDVERQDAKNLLSAALGNAPSPTSPTGAGSSSGSSSTPIGVTPVAPMMPVYAKPVHPWLVKHPKLYNLLSN
jgi:hypothetical protein